MKQHDTSGFWKDCSLSIDTSMSCAPFHLPVTSFWRERTNPWRSQMLGTSPFRQGGHEGVKPTRERGGRRAGEPNPGLGRASGAR
jgi:hypothetical protein